MGSGKLGDSGMIAITAKIMMAVIVFLFFVVVLVFFLHIYAKFFTSYRQEEDGNPNDGTRRRRRRRRRVDFAGGYQEANALRRGLDPSILKIIPVIPFNTKDFKDGLECSVCLSKVSEGEKARLLPKCNHGFHVDCIDMWLQSHITCPLCRNPVSELSSPKSTIAESNFEAIRIPVEEGSAASTETPNLLTNVLFWGDETTTSSASTSNRPDGVLMIDIPRQNSEEAEEEQKTPTPTRLRSLTRLFSSLNPRSPRNVDVEQGSRGQN